MVRLIESPRRHDMHGATFDAFASPSTGSMQTAVWVVQLPPGSAGVEHSVTHEEVFIALEGSASVRCGEQQLTLPAGAALVVPAATPFSLSNRGDVPFRAVVAFPVGGQAVLGNGQAFVPPWAC